MGTYTSTRFAGTDLVGEHIGEAPARRLAGMIGNDDSTPVKAAEVSASAEDADKITVAYQLVDSNGDSVATSRPVQIVLHDADGKVGLTAAMHSTITTGAAVSTNAKASVFATTDDTGALVFDVEDGTGALAGDVICVVEVLGGFASKTVTTLTFA